MPTSKKVSSRPSRSDKGAAHPLITGLTPEQEKVRLAIASDDTSLLAEVRLEFEKAGLPLESPAWSLGGGEASWALPTYAVHRNAFRCLAYLCDLAIEIYGEQFLDDLFEERPRHSLNGGVRAAIAILDQRIRANRPDGLLPERKRALVELLGRIHQRSDLETWTSLVREIGKDMSAAAAAAQDVMGAAWARTEESELVDELNDSRPDLVSQQPAKKHDFRA